MPQSNDEEERETMLKRQKRHEESTMRSNVNLQQLAKLLKNIKPHISPKQKKRSDGQEQQRWPKREPKSQAHEELEEQMQEGKLDLPNVQQPTPIPQSYEGMLPSRPSSVIRTNIYVDI